jgi:hypothetical protein
MAYYQSPPAAEDEWLTIKEISSGTPPRDQNSRSDQRIRTRHKKAAIDPFYSFARKVTNDRPSSGKRVLRTLSWFFMAVLLGVGATLGWQSCSDAVREMIATRAPMLTWLLSVPTTRSPVVIATNPMQQLESLASTLNVMRRSVERLVADQEQMAQNIELLQAVEEDIRKKIWFTPPAQQATSLIQEQLSQPGALASAPRTKPPAGPASLSR